MEIDDFRGMRRGASVFALSKQDASLLNAIERRNDKKENALLLLHGFTSTPAVYRTMLPSLSFYDAIVCPVLPGHAESLEAFAKVKAEAWFMAAEKSCALLLEEYAHVDVLGLSLGGMLACYLSNRFKLHHLYLLAPAFDLHLSLDRTLKLAKVLNWLGFKEVRGFSGDLFTENHCEIAYRKLPLSSIIEISNLIKHYPFVLPGCPTDIFLGRHDKVVACNRVAERFTNVPNATIHWLENSAHVIPLDGDTDRVIHCMRTNLNVKKLSSSEDNSLVIS